MSDYEQLWRSLNLDLPLHHQILESIEKNFKTRVLNQKNRPARMAYFDGVLHGAHGERVEEIIERKKDGAKFIGTFCIYVPEEIIYALGSISLALCGGTPLSIPYAEKMFPRNICPLVKSTLGLAFSRTCPYAPIKDLAVGETTCDAKKKAWDVLAKKVAFHVLEVPQKKSLKDKELWLEEVRAFKSRMEKLTGKSLEKEKLGEAIKIYNRKRKALMKLYSFRQHDRPPLSGLDTLVVLQAALIDDPVRFTSELELLNEELEERIKNNQGVAEEGAPRIMVAGCPAVMGNWKLHYLLESSGAIVVCDETCTGTRYFQNLVEEKDQSIDDMLVAIAERYFKINCSCFTPNEERIENILTLARDFKVDGVVHYILSYCHTYNIETINIDAALKRQGIPSLKIETDYSEEDIGQLRIRIEAFLEGIKQRGK